MNDFFWEFILPWSIAIIVVLLVFFGGCSISSAILSHATIDSDISQVEQVRSDICKLSGNERESAVGKAVEWNETIRSARTYNNKWWADWMLSDKVEKVKLIDVTCRDKKQP